MTPAQAYAALLDITGSPELTDEDKFVQIAYLLTELGYTVNLPTPPTPEA